MEIQPIPARKIGIIERDNEIAEVLQLALEVEGYNIAHLAHKGLTEQSFSRFIRHHRPPLVLFDIPYPYRDNWELYQQLINTKGNSRRKFIPMGSFDRQFADMLQEGGQIFIPKPFDLDHLFDTIDQNYPRRKTRQAALHQPIMQNLVVAQAPEGVLSPYLAPIQRGN